MVSVHSHRFCRSSSNCISGIWDCLSSQQSVDFVRRSIASGKSLPDICEDMMNHCLAPDNDRKSGIGMDNMTIIVLAFLHGRTEEEWMAWIKKKIELGNGYPTSPTFPACFGPQTLRHPEQVKTDFSFALSPVSEPPEFHKYRIRVRSPPVYKDHNCNL